MKFKKRTLILIKTTELPKFFRGTDNAYLITTKSYSIKQTNTSNTFIIKDKYHLSATNKIFYLQKRDHIKDLYQLLEFSTIDNLKFKSYNEILKYGFSKEELDEAINKLKLVRNDNLVAKLCLDDIVSICKLYKSLIIIWNNNNNENNNKENNNNEVTYKINKNNNFNKYLEKELLIYPEVIRKWVIQNINYEFADYILNYEESMILNSNDDFNRVVLND
ncbi:hypothetical protein DMUE_1564 [Dictyocoela muelleri]|nr:hypothetical protein DMUE_1564 [Dictyocoela muelleri]